MQIVTRDCQIYAKSTGAQGSAMLKNIIKIEGIMLLSEDKNEVKKGEIILVKLM